MHTNIVGYSDPIYGKCPCGGRGAPVCWLHVCLPLFVLPAVGFRFPVRRFVDEPIAVIPLLIDFQCA